MALAALLLFAQGFAAWALALGLDAAGGAGGTGGGGLTALPPGVRVLAVALAVLSPVAGIGAWFRAQWGPVLWGLVIVALAVAAALELPHPAIVPLLAAHGALALLWALATALAERRGAPGAGGRASLTEGWPVADD